MVCALQGSELDILDPLDDVALHHFLGIEHLGRGFDWPEHDRILVHDRAYNLFPGGKGHFRSALVFLSLFVFLHAYILECSLLLQLAATLWCLTAGCLQRTFAIA